MTCLVLGGDAVSIGTPELVDDGAVRAPEAGCHQAEAGASANRTSRSPTRTLPAHRSYSDLGSRSVGVTAVQAANT